MRTPPGFVSGAALLVLSCGVASAGSTFSVSGVTTFTTDGSYQLTLDKFNPTLCGAPGCTLTGATLYFFGSEDVSSLTLTNSAAGAQTFDLLVTSDLAFGSGNTANPADSFSGEALDIFDTGMGPGHAQYPTVPGPITLGGSGTPACAEYTPLATCSSVAYTPPGIIANNTDPVYGLPSGTGLGGVTGVTENLNVGDLLAHYVGAGSTFNLTGSTKNALTFSGGGGNISLALATSATFQAEIDYSYTVNPATPEPGTMALMAGAFLCLGLLRKRN